MKDLLGEIQINKPGWGVRENVALVEKFGVVSESPRAPT